MTNGEQREQREQRGTTGNNGNNGNNGCHDLAPRAQFNEESRPLEAPPLSTQDEQCRGDGTLLTTRGFIHRLASGVEGCRVAPSRAMR